MKYIFVYILNIFQSTHLATSWKNGTQFGRRHSIAGWKMDKRVIDE